MEYTIGLLKLLLKAHFGPYPDKCQWYALKNVGFGMRTT